LHYCVWVLQFFGTTIVLFRLETAQACASRADRRHWLTNGLVTSCVLRCRPCEDRRIGMGKPHGTTLRRNLQGKLAYIARETEVKMLLAMKADNVLAPMQAEARIQPRLRNPDAEPQRYRPHGKLFLVFYLSCSAKSLPPASLRSVDS
jgi:hypothetical protein